MTKEIVPSSFTFNNYVINKSIFEVNQSFEPTDNVTLDFQLSSDIKINKTQDEALVILMCEIFKDAKENNYPFYMSIEIVGDFSLEGEIGVDFINLCKVNGTAILFPYVRSYISHVTSMSGVPNLILPTLNVLEMLEDE
ncbi:hypothetical protein C2I06_22520 [Niallia circulans]|uniref:protein-export chaperone SecB n=1 Tax=Niallia circulans TaxID=1397 RepID=UPI000F45B46B|nr:protein-export chaperone SecB [Niallia circulans]AYV69397.1 hypothetical protein C2I06_22520 [Niallia circulans]